MVAPAKWKHPISWSNYKTLRTCPWKFELHIRKVPFVVQSPTYYAVLGSTVQRVFELFFLDESHRIHPDSHWRNLRLLIMKVLKSSWFRKMELTYPSNKDFKIFVTEVGEIVKHSIEKWNEKYELWTLLSVKPEVDLRCNYLDIRLRGIVDFVIETNTNKILVYDGKVNKRKNADPEQLLFYAMLLKFKGFTADHIAFFYWRHGIEEIEDFSPQSIEDFRTQRFDPWLPLFRALGTVGVTGLPAKPSADTCRFCDFRYVCAFSFYKNETKPGMGKVEEIDF